MQNRLDDLLARDVVPQWFEGIAVVQLVCRQLRTQGLETSSFPGAADILIAPGGSVTDYRTIRRRTLLKPRRTCSGSCWATTFLCACGSP